VTPDDFFIGWAESPPRDRRFLLGVTLSALIGGAGFGALLADAHQPAGSGTWDLSTVRTFTGQLLRDPYPILVASDIDGTPRMALLVSDSKRGLQRLVEQHPNPFVTITGTLITRGRHAMIAAVGGNDWITDAAAVPVTPMPEVDEGPAMVLGEILDAKCWFGAMRPGDGKVHKACASLCVRGGLPLAFCANGCGDGAEIFLFLDAEGKPHGPELLPFVADPVYANGQIIRVGDLRQFRVSLRDLHRV
jgi:hypothetical protein